MKVFHANCFCTPEAFYHDYIKDLYRCYNTILEPTIDYKEADLYSICNYVGPQTHFNYDLLDKSKVILYQYEPPWTSSEWGEWADIEIQDKQIKKFLDIPRHGTVIQPFYDVKSQAFRPCPDNNNVRINKMAFITSLWNKQPGHLIRNQFVQWLHDQEYDYDLYGGVEYTMIDKTIDMFHQYKGPCTNKYHILNRYKYSLAIENTNERGWYSEKFYDAILSDNLVFYCGCENLEDYFPPKSFIRLPLPDFKRSYEIIEKAIYDNEWEKRRADIAEAKRIVLYERDLIHTLERYA